MGIGELHLKLRLPVFHLNVLFLICPHFVWNSLHFLLGHENEILYLNWTHFTCFYIQDSGMCMIILFVSRSNFIPAGTVSPWTAARKAKYPLFGLLSRWGSPTQSPQGPVYNGSDKSGLRGKWGSRKGATSSVRAELLLGLTVWLLLENVGPGWVDLQNFKRETRNTHFMWNFLRLGCWQLTQIVFKNTVQAK